MHRRALGRDAEALQGPVRQLGDDGRFGPGEPLAADERVVDLMLRLAGPRLLAYQKLPREHAVGVRIGARADARVVREHFGCHIRAGPNDRRHLRQRVRQLLADPEVRDLAPNYAAALGYQHVARLEVTVYNSTRVQVREPRGDVARRVQDVLMDERPARILVNYVVEVAGHELGHDVEAVRGLAHAVEDEHVLVRKIGHDYQLPNHVVLHLRAEARDERPLHGDSTRPRRAAERRLLVPRAPEDDGEAALANLLRLEHELSRGDLPNGRRELRRAGRAAAAVGRPPAGREGRALQFV